MNIKNIFLLLTLLCFTMHKPAFSCLEPYDDFLLPLPDEEIARKIKEHRKRHKAALLNKFNHLIEQSEHTSKLNPLLNDLIHHKRLDLLEKALHAGANPNYQESSLTILEHAILHGSCDAVDLLLRYGANPNHIDKVSGTPLLRASEGEFMPLSLPMLTSLLNHKANPNIKSGLFNNTPLTQAVITLEKWRKYKVSPTTYLFLTEEKIEDEVQKDLEAIKLLLDHGANPLIENNKGESAIKIAQNCSDDALVQLLSNVAKK